MKLVKTEDAVGLILCHDITEIVRGGVKGAAFKKGHVVTEEDIEYLLRLGKENLYVWEDDPSLIHENDAALFLVNLTMGEGITAGTVSEGKISLKASMDGLFVSDIEALNRLNSDMNICIASRFAGFPVKKGDELAAMRVIPLAVTKKTLERAENAVEKGKKVFNVLEFKKIDYSVINTGSELYKGRIKDTFTPVLEEKLSKYGCRMKEHAILDDEADAITHKILEMRDNGAGLIMVTGGMSVDPDDRTPTAIRNTGAEIVTYGTPVLPGAMFLLAYLGDIPILGLPGCVMHSGRTVFDIILPKIMAGVKVTRSFISGLGNGGLIGAPIPFPYSKEGM